MADGRDGKLHVLPMDVSNLASIRAAAAELKGKSIDLLLNNAGVGGPRGPSETSITKLAQTYSKSTPWALSESPRHSSIM
jgi:NAD(P)-dependent dehydrogenase (short-subunit alcohol dehydrogenase family)